MFKIDNYDKAMTHHSPDPADPSVTERVITIMLAQVFGRYRGKAEVSRTS